MHHTMNGPSPIVRQAAEFSSVNATQANDPLHPGAGKLISHLRNARGRINANGLSGHGDVLHRIIESIDLDDIDELAARIDRSDEHTAELQPLMRTPYAGLHC